MVEQIKNYSLAAALVIMSWGGLSIFVTSVTEIIKKIIKEKVKNHAWIMTLICFLIAFAVGFGWKIFVEITFFQCGVLSVFLFFTSTYAYNELKDSDTKIGKWLTSLSAYFDADKIVEIVIAYLYKKIAKVDNSIAQSALTKLVESINEKLLEIADESETITE
ncbi:MAG: hypothetical protein ACC608_09625 [Anaerofustis sp.]